MTIRPFLSPITCCKDIPPPAKAAYATPHSRFAANDTRSDSFETHYLSENNYACGIIIAQENNI